MSAIWAARNLKRQEERLDEVITDSSSSESQFQQQLLRTIKAQEILDDAVFDENWDSEEGRRYRAQMKKK